MSDTIHNKKKCSTCWEFKAFDGFSKHSKNGLQNNCKNCAATIKKKYVKHNHKQISLKEREYRLINKYGLTADDYNNILTSQNGVCKICKKTEGGCQLVVDHDHKTGVVRGLLCNRCNKGIGLFDDNYKIIDSSIIYLMENYDA